MGQEAISTIDLQENLTASAHTAMIMMEADQIIDLEVDMNNEEDITNTEVVLHAGDRLAAASIVELPTEAHNAVVDRPTDPVAPARPAGIATARERAERTFPPDGWMGGSHCRGDV